MSNLKFRQFDKRLNDFMFFELNNGRVHIINNDIESFDIDRVDSPIEQYTGIKDKNGVEIYEGDILSTDLSRPYLVVEFRGGAFMYQCHDSGNDYYDFMSPSDEPRTQDKYCAVIGNIHQNPELLEQNDE